MLIKTICPVENLCCCVFVAAILLHCTILRHWTPNGNVACPGYLGSIPKERKNRVVLIDQWMLYANAMGAMYTGQSKVVLSVNNARYFWIFLLATSAWLLHAPVRCCCGMFDLQQSINSFAKLLQNSFSLYETNSKDAPNLHTHYSKILLATFLLSMAANTVYFVKTSVKHGRNFLPWLLLFNDLKRSRWYSVWGHGLRKSILFKKKSHDLGFTFLFYTQIGDLIFKNSKYLVEGIKSYKVG